jgi:hypothetical protein
MYKLPILACSDGNIYSHLLKRQQTVACAPSIKNARRA